MHLSKPVKDPTLKPRVFEPHLLAKDFKVRLVTIIERIQAVEFLQRAEALLQELVQVPESLDEHRFNVSLSLLSDLAEQGWTLQVRDDQIFVDPPRFNAENGESIDCMKRRARRGLQRASNRQLAEKSVEDFLRKMERDGGGPLRKKSVLSLVDSGAELAVELRALQHLSKEQQLAKLAKLVKPTIHECSPEGRCEFTGLKLQDIWRYFRHTWSLEYNPLPGRTLRLLIRNSARTNAPVIGIAMLASPSANMYVRDNWIGWRGPDDVISGILMGRWAPKDVAQALVKAVEGSISDIRTDDLLEPEELKRPTAQTFFRLEQLTIRSTASRSEDLRDEVERIVDIRGFKGAALQADDWRSLSETSLYRKKRCEALLPLLRTVRYFLDNDFYVSPGAAVMEALTTRRGREAVSVALGEIKKMRSASEIADVAVCGSIAPYNELLGGKLVTLLMGSQDTRRIYAKRYQGQVSEIASQLAGRPVVRSADLKVLTTTSLYGIGANQYTRTKVTATDSKKLKADVRWEYLDTTTGFTVTHVSRRTVQLMRQMAVLAYGRRRINSVFGEGSSPRTRQIREGLSLLGINNDDLLRQSVGRKVYAFEYFGQAREVLLGFNPKVKSRSAEAAAAIADAWRTRWLIRRATRQDVLARLDDLQPETLRNRLLERAAEGRLDAGSDLRL